MPLGILRHPSFWNWDLTLQRRFPIPAGGRQVQARLQLQLYNIFNTPQFTTLNTALTFQDDPNVPGVDNLLPDEHDGSAVHGAEQRYRHQPAA